MKLYVGNLSFETTENDLQDLFEQHGKVAEVSLIMDRMTGKSRGFAFVTMNEAAEANAAMAAINGKEIGGRALSVNEARAREERPRPSGNNHRPYASFRRSRIVQPAPETFRRPACAIKIWAWKKLLKWKGQSCRFFPAQCFVSRWQTSTSCLRIFREKCANVLFALRLATA